jgi:23S rRNA (uracil1939-C5)-methyltransferase
VVHAIGRCTSLARVYTEPVAPAKPGIRYRTRAKLIVASGGKIGLFAKGGGHQVVDIPGCRVLAPSLSHVAAVLRAHLAAAELRDSALAPVDSSDRGWLRAVDLREVRDRDAVHVLVTFVVQRERTTSLEPLRQAACELMRDAPLVAGVACNFHEGEAPQILGSETVALAGATTLPDRIGSAVHFASFGSFTQTHREQAALVHALLAESTGARVPRRDGTKRRILDLYGGSGAISLSLATAGASVTMVESFGPAVAGARAASAAQHLDVQAEVADVSSALRAHVERHERYDAIIVNPPRRGTSPLTRELLARLAPEVIGYVSCDPDTLARDLDHLAHLGYAATSVWPIDMIPMTDEVETVAILRRAPPASARIVFADRDVLAVEKAPHEPTSPREGAISLVDRVRRIAGAEGAVPVGELDVGTSGLVMFVRDPANLEAWQQAFAAAGSRQIFVVGVRGLTPTKGTISRDLRDRHRVIPARTRYRRLAFAGGHSILRVVPHPPGAYAIRRHFAAVGHPVLGDCRFGHEATNRFFEEKYGLDRTFLHCVRLEFEHPVTHRRHVVETQLPADLRIVLERTNGTATLRFLEQTNALGTSGTSHLPPAPDEVLDEGSALELDSGSPSLRPQIVGDDDVSNG